MRKKIEAQRTHKAKQSYEQKNVMVNTISRQHT